MVLTRHVARNALGPAVTVVGLILGGLVGGASVTEAVFSIPGIGRLLVEAIYARDYPMLQGCLLLIAFIYVLVNLPVDLACAALLRTPRGRRRPWYLRRINDVVGSVLLAVVFATAAMGTSGSPTTPSSRTSSPASPRRPRRTP